MKENNRNNDQLLEELKELRERIQEPAMALSALATGWTAQERSFSCRSAWDGTAGLFGS